MSHSINILKPAVFDLSDGDSSPATKAETPVTQLPPMVVDWDAATDVPALLVTVRHPMGMGPEVGIAHGVALVNRLSEWERSFGGTGLRAVAPPSISPPGTLRLLLIPVTAAGAGERLARVAAAATNLQSTYANPSPLSAPAFERFTADVVGPGLGV